jgi:hypothetical protein
MDRKRWAPVVRAFSQSLQSTGLDARENVAFEGRGEQTRFIHSRFPDSGCAIAIEFKKTFMDEWSGEPDRGAIARFQYALTAAVPAVEHALERMD